MIRKDQDALRQLLQLGLVVVVSVCVWPTPQRSQVGEGYGSHSFLTLPLLQSSQENQEPDQQKLLTSVIIGLVVSLVLVLMIMITALMCLRKRYDLYFSPSLQLSPDPDVQCVCGWVERAWLGSSPTSSLAESTLCYIPPWI